MLLENLDSEFQDKLAQLISRMKELDYEASPHFGFRCIYDEARIWRRSRSGTQFEFLLAQLKANGAHYAASVLEGVEIQKPGFHGTDTFLYNYHLLGKAVDVRLVGKPCDSDHYDLLAEEAIKLGLTPGRYFRNMKSGHIRLGEKNLEDIYTMAEMDEILKKIHEK